MTNDKKSFNFDKSEIAVEATEGVERTSSPEITQVHLVMERVPHGRRGVVEPSWTLSVGICFGSWDVQKSVQARQMSAFWHDRRKLKLRNALIW